MPFRLNNRISVADSERLIAIERGVIAVPMGYTILGPFDGWVVKERYLIAIRRPEWPCSDPETIISSKGISDCSIDLFASP